MTWYAIRVMPGAQMPQREYATETTNSRKGYRIVPSLNPRMSAVERALSDAGFTHYMPAEFVVIRDRKKTGAYCIRRFPLLPGYVFVTSCAGVKDVPGVAGIVGKQDGRDPLPIGIMDILALRTIEARGEAKAAQDLAQISSQVISDAKKIAVKARAAAKRKLDEGKEVKILWGEAIGREATLAGWADETRVKAILHGLDNAGTVVLVPYDAVRLVA